MNAKRHCVRMYTFTVRVIATLLDRPSIHRSAELFTAVASRIETIKLSTPIQLASQLPPIVPAYITEPQSIERRVSRLHRLSFET